MTTTTKRVIVAAVAVLLAVAGVLILTGNPADAATCTTDAHQDATGRWHNPNGQFCAYTAPATTRPPATTCPPRTSTTAPVTTLPPKPCPTTSTTSTSTTRPEATTTTTVARDPGCRPGPDGRNRDEHGLFCTPPAVPRDPGDPVPPAAVRALPRYTG